MSLRFTEILETVRMVADQNFDVRTLTIGIDLHDCISPDIDQLNQNIYDKITRVGKNLVQVARELSAKYGVPIVNQRISVTPIAQIAAKTNPATLFALSGSVKRLHPYGYHSLNVKMQAEFLLCDYLAATLKKS